MTALADIGYLAGIIDGEGWIRGDAMGVHVEMCDEDVIRRLATIANRGTISGPRDRKNGRKPQWGWHVYGEDAARVLWTVWPLLGERRRADAAASIRGWLSRPRRGANVRRRSDKCGRGHAAIPENRGRWNDCKLCAALRYTENRDRILARRKAHYYANRAAISERSRLRYRAKANPPATKGA